MGEVSQKLCDVISGRPLEQLYKKMNIYHRLLDAVVDGTLVGPRRTEKKIKTIYRIIYDYVIKH